MIHGRENLTRGFGVIIILIGVVVLATAFLGWIGFGTGLIVSGVSFVFLADSKKEAKK